MKETASATRPVEVVSRAPAAAPPASQRSEPGRPAAFEAWIESALERVPGVARQFVRPGILFEDLLCAGNLGLVEAALRFDPSRNVQFITYAVWWIRKAIRSMIHQQTGAVRLPAYTFWQLWQLKEARRELRIAQGREPSTEELADALGLDAARVRTLLSARDTSVSLDQPALGGERHTLADRLSRDGERSHLDDIVLGNCIARLRRLIGTLPSRERQVLSLRYGLRDDEPMTLKQIGQSLGLSRERVRQLEHDALDRLRRGFGPVTRSRG
jgi:RNA polymerase primary sigma factor